MLGLDFELIYKYYVYINQYKTCSLYVRFIYYNVIKNDANNLMQKWTINLLKKFYFSIFIRLGVYL